MNNIYAVIGEILDEHITERFEMTELADAPVAAVVCRDGNVSVVSDELSDFEKVYILDRYKFRELLPDLNQNFSIVGYLVGQQFYVFAVMVDGEEKEMCPRRRAYFMELFNHNLADVRLQHVPTLPFVMNFDGAKKALDNGSDRRDVEKYTIQAVTELCSGISKMTKTDIKGYAFKSMDSDFSFKALSEKALMSMGDL